MSLKRTIAVIQARTGSSRLPGKVLMELHPGVSILEHQCRRLSRVDGVDALIIATTDQPGDDRIAALAARLGLACVRGSDHDVLNRFVKAGRATGAGTLVRITSDSPFRDPGVIAACVAHHHGGGYEYTRPGADALPKGLRAEVVETKVLEQLDADPATSGREREHVTAAIRDNPDRYRCGAPDFPERWARPHYDLSVDTPEDLAFVRALWRDLEARGWPADIDHICALLDARASELESKGGAA